MTTQTVSAARGGLRFGAAFSAALIGLTLVFVTGLVQAETLHTAAHDVRHATGFPCH